MMCSFFYQLLINFYQNQNNGKRDWQYANVEFHDKSSKTQYFHVFQITSFATLPRSKKTSKKKVAWNLSAADRIKE